MTMVADMPSAQLSPEAGRVLIIDDSIVARSILSRMVAGTDRFQVAAAVADSAAGLAFLATQTVDIILLDIGMPGVDGLTALPQVLAAGKGAKVLIVSSFADEGAEASVQALALGAADTLAKPGVGAFGGRFASVLEDRLLRLIDAPETVSPPSDRAAPNRAAPAFDLVAIGASTGGIHALGQFLRAIPAAFQVPMLITQHLPPAFMHYFAAQISVLGRRPCDVACDHMRIRPGTIVVAPGDAHIRVVRMSDGAAIRLSAEPAPSGCMPSVDPMFASVAEVFGARALGIVLSGMGRDGCEGAQQLARTGARIFVQDQETSVVWGMPGAVAKAGCAAAILPPDAIGRLVAGGRLP